MVNFTISKLISPYLEFLIDKKGHVVERFSPSVKPTAIIPAIEKLLSAWSSHFDRKSSVFFYTYTWNGTILIPYFPFHKCSLSSYAQIPRLSITTEAPISFGARTIRISISCLYMPHIRVIYMECTVAKNGCMQQKFAWFVAYYLSSLRFAQISPLVLQKAD